MKTTYVGTRGYQAPELLKPKVHERLRHLLNGRHPLHFARWVPAVRGCSQNGQVVPTTCDEGPRKVLACAQGSQD